MLMAQSFQMFLNPPATSCKFASWLSIIFLEICTPKNNLFAIYAGKVENEPEIQKATDGFKTIRGSSPNDALHYMYTSMLIYHIFIP
jgi:hypothetical protein